MLDSELFVNLILNLKQTKRPQKAVSVERARRPAYFVIVCQSNDVQWTRVIAKLYDS